MGMRIVWMGMWLLMCAAPLKAQTASVWAELGGNGTLYSLGYEHMLAGKFPVRLGAGYSSARERGTDKRLQLLALPITLGYAPVLREGHRLEVGAGLSLLYVSSDLNSYTPQRSLYPNITATLAYRRYWDRWWYRLAFTPLYGMAPLQREEQPLQAPLGVGRFQPWAGISLGYRLL